MRIGGALCAVFVVVACGGTASHTRDSGSGGAGANSLPGPGGKPGSSQGGKSGSSQGGKSGSAPKDEPMPPVAGTTSVSVGGSGPAQGGATHGGGGPISMAGRNNGSGGRGAINSVCASSEECPTDAFCKQGFCACPLNLPDFCPDPDNLPGACVSRQSDPKNCGLCDRACPDGAACNAGKCGDAPTTVVGTSECGQMRLVVQGQTLYFTKPLSGEVKAVPLAGGDLVDLTDPLQGTPTAIVADADGVYWIDQGNGTVGSSRVMKKPLPLTNGEPIILVASPSSAPLPALAVSDGKLYYAFGHDVHARSTDPAQAGDAIVATATNYDVEPPQVSGDPAALWVSFGSVCWTTASRYGVERDGSEPGNDAGYVKLAQSVGGLLLSTIYCNSNYAYFADGDRLQRSSALPPTDLAQTPKNDPITAFAIGASAAYFAGETGAVYRQAIDADIDVPPSALAMTQSLVTAIAVDAQRIYWATDKCSIRSAPQ